MTCFVAPYDFGSPMYCRVNASLTRAFTPDMPEGYEPLPAEQPKSVVVVGGGPAGMEAARIAAQRGHRVTLIEQGSALGGSLDLVQAVKGPHEKVDAHKEFLANELARLGVEVRCGETATAESVTALGPNAAVVAVGSQITPLPVEDGTGTVTFDTLREAVANGDELPLGGDAVIVGAQFEACDVARYLLRRGKRVTMVNPGPEGEFFMGAPTWPRMMGKRWLAAKGLDVMHGATVLEVSAGLVTVQTPYGVTRQIPCDTVVNALPQQADRTLAGDLEALGIPTFAVGNCYAPSTIANAVARTNLVRRHVEDPDWGKAAQASLAQGETFAAIAVGIGDVTVSIAVEGGAIVDAAMDTSNETDGIGRRLGEQFAAQIVERGAIDAVSGATLTSNATAKALAACLKQAGLA